MIGSVRCEVCGKRPSFDVCAGCELYVCDDCARELDPDLGVLSCKACDAPTEMS